MQPDSRVGDQRDGPFPVAAWAVVIRGFVGAEDDEIAAVFGDRKDACGYADWWNGGEIRRYGADSPLRAVVEEIDFYPYRTWHPPAASPRSRDAQSWGLAHVV